MSRGLGSAERAILDQLTKYGQATIPEIVDCQCYEICPGRRVARERSVRRALKSLEAKGLVDGSMLWKKTKATIWKAV